MNRTFSILAVLMLSSALAAGCTMSREQSGAVLGGAVGAAAGSAVGKGGGRTVAIVLGALLGSVVGANIGRSMDEQDRIRTARVMEYNPTGTSSSWTNPDTRATYTVTPTQTYQSARGPCREFTMKADIDGRPSDVYGTACRQPDGSWRIVN